MSHQARPSGRVAASVQSSYAVGYAISVSLSAGHRRALLGGDGLEGVLRPRHRAGRPASSSSSAARAGIRHLHAGKGRAIRRRGVAAVWTIFTGRHLRRTFAAAVMSTGIFGGAYVMITWLPTYLRTALGLSIKSSTAISR